jgi:isopenicillin-N epimerase
MNSIKDLFLLDPNIIFLNHGSFGACPRPVFDVYQSWQCELERQPVEFIGRRATDLLAEARSKLSSFLQVSPDEVVYYPNSTTAINMVARSMELKPGDEILTTDHEYGAMDRTWRFICKQTGARYVQVPVQLPVSDPEYFIENFWSGVNENTRLIFLSHITSPTALVFPVHKICARARQHGIPSFIDGAHAPGQIELNLAEVGADLYTGACHKWLMAPKGSAFLYARREFQPRLLPLVVSWGYESEYPGPSQFIDYHQWQGTRDIAAFLSVPAAIDFQRQYHWEKIRQECHALAYDTVNRINALTCLPSIYPPTDVDDRKHTWFHQMFVAPLPDEIDSDQLKRQLYDDFHIEAPITRWKNTKFIRVSIQGYNDQADCDALVNALDQLL